MKKQEQYVAAIDIGTTKIVSIVGKKNDNGKIEILGLSKAPSNGVKRGVVLNIEETVAAIRKTVEDVQGRSGIGFADVFVGIAGQHLKSMKSRGERGSPNRSMRSFRFTERPTWFCGVSWRWWRISTWWRERLSVPTGPWYGTMWEFLSVGGKMRRSNRGNEFSKWRRENFLRLLPT